MSNLSSNHQNGLTTQDSDQSMLLRAMAVAGLLALLALATPLIWAAVSAGLGLAALAGLGAVGFAVFQTMPLALQKLENRLLAARKAEALSNPVEQLQNECLRRAQRLMEFRRALVSIGAKIESMTEMVQERAHLDPNHVLERQMRALQRMRHFYDVNVQRLNDAQAALEAFQTQVKRKAFEWEFAIEGRIVMRALKPDARENLLQDLLTDTALRTVQDRFNTVFAELDVEMRTMKGMEDFPLDFSATARLDTLQLPPEKARRKL